MTEATFEKINFDHKTNRYAEAIEIAAMLLLNYRPDISELFKHINTEGRDLNGKLFVDLGVFHKNYATARDSIGWFHINKDGEQLYKERFRMVEPFYNGSAFVETNSKKKIIIDEGGNTILGESI